MQVNVLFFARLRHDAGVAGATLEVPAGATVRDLAARLEAQFPVKLTGCMVAVNEAYSTPDQQLGSGDEVAFLPPVAGGSGPGSSGPGEINADLTREVLSLEEAAQWLVRPECGAQAYFVGTVRSPNAGQTVNWIDYEGYAPMARKIMHEAAAQAQATHGSPLRIYLRHRTGRLQPTEASILIGVASPHRRAALEACDLLIEYLKVHIPVWKHESSAGGAVWVAGQAGHPTL